ncbi:hypothetical protein [Arthrobacter sp. UYCo732]|uniref:hypothetical protein n=1 Tax=Arthrobacter sp. UYCo732 TaxID=3156336 RepID=UPI003398A9BE
MPQTEDHALAVLNDWFAGKGSSVAGSTADAWNITSYRDAFLFSSGGGRRSNTLYVVLGRSVCQFAASTGSLEDAYRSIGGTQ